VNEPARRQISTWQEAELNARDWMRFWGYTDAKVTVSGADAGIDVKATGALAQVKFEASQVGRPQLQKLVGARARTDAQLFFFSGAGYSQQAIDYANHMHIALFHYSLDGRMSPLNSTAEHLTKRRAKGPGQSETPAPEPGSGAMGCGCLVLLASAFMLIGVINTISNPANSSKGLSGAILVIFCLAVMVGGVLLMRKGARTARAAKEASSPENPSE
jgi:hypothetical protein